MYFDEERNLTQTECRLANTTGCNKEMVFRNKTISVTECGVVEEESCLNVMDTRVEEECKIVNDRVCAPISEETTTITEVKPRKMIK